MWYCISRRSKSLHFLLIDSLVFPRSSNDQDGWEDEHLVDEADDAGHCRVDRKGLQDGGRREDAISEWHYVRYWNVIGLVHLSFTRCNLVNF